MLSSVLQFVFFRRKDRSQWLNDTRNGLAPFVQFLGSDKPALLRDILIHDICRRTTLFLQLKFPHVASIFSHLIPVVGPVRELRNTPVNKPLIIALGHFTQTYFVLAVMLRLFGRRTVHVAHLDGPLFDKTDRFLRQLGINPVVTDDNALRNLAKAVREDPHCAVVIAYDYFGGKGRLPIPFLGKWVAAPRGLAFLADETGAAVYTAWGEVRRTGPRVVINGPFEVDVNLDRQNRQNALTERLFQLLEAQVSKAPQQWTEWDQLAWPHVVSRMKKLTAEKQAIETRSHHQIGI